MHILDLICWRYNIILRAISLKKIIKWSNGKFNTKGSMIKVSGTHKSSTFGRKKNNNFQLNNSVVYTKTYDYFYTYFLPTHTHIVGHFNVKKRFDLLSDQSQTYQKHLLGYRKLYSSLLLLRNTCRCFYYI